MGFLLVLVVLSVFGLTRLCVKGFQKVYTHRKINAYASGLQLHKHFQPSRRDAGGYSPLAEKTEIAEIDVDPKMVRLTKFLIALWNKISFPPSAEDQDEVTFTLDEYGLNRKDVTGFLKHFQLCKDCSAENAFLMASKHDGKDSLTLRNVFFPLAVEDENAEEWGQFDKSEENLGSLVAPPPPFQQELDDEVVLKDTKEWVRKIIADFGVCPFTIDPERAGIPMGGVRYTVSRAQNTEGAFLAFWEDVLAMVSVPEKEMATVLLVFPELHLFGNFELFEQYCECLGDALSVSSMNMENELQLVFFHPKYSFRDGHARQGNAKGAANFARRGPWPMVNILRTSQVRAAQKGIPTGQVYQQNEERLSKVGTKVLEDMLFSRNWQGLPSYAHNTKSIRAKAEDLLREKRGADAGEVTVEEIAQMASSMENNPPPECPFHESPPTNGCVNTNTNTHETQTLETMVEADVSKKTAEELIAMADEVEKWLGLGN